ncbi:MAG TPA: hypothetical protein VGS07_28185 [Thermoanaerobaculia bacterium]|jgi:hypothetical protein|nr:hypothetical protein [Thermoanaerobaculia bacterium]
MRKMIGLFALLSLLAPFGVYAAALPEASATPSAPNPTFVLNLVQSPQVPMTPAHPAVGLFESTNSGAIALPAVVKVCSDSCRKCAGTCPPGEGFCTPNPC